MAAAAAETEVATSSEGGDVMRKRQYRVGLNLFNLNPEHGVEYLAQKGFIARNPSEVAKFLHGRKGLSKAKVGTRIIRAVPTSHQDDQSCTCR